MIRNLRAMGRMSFVLGVGIVGFGVPAALVVNRLAVWFRGESAAFVSASNAIELTFTLLFVAPVVGLVLGRAIWRRLDR